MPHHVLVDDLPVLLGVGEHVRPGAHDAHVAHQHVEELRELVDVGATDEVAEGEFPGVVLGGLHLVGIGVDMHGTELDASERLAINARPLLLEEERPRTLPLDDACDDGQEWQEDDAHDDAHHHVEGTFDKPVEGLGEWLVMVGEHHGVAQLLRLQVEKEVAHHPRHIIKMYEVFVAEAYDAHDLLVLVVGETTKHLVGLCEIEGGILRGCFGQAFRHPFVQLLQGAVVCYFRRAVVHTLVGEIALDFVACGGVGDEVAVQHEQRRVVAYEQHAPGVATSLAEILDEQFL